MSWNRVAVIGAGLIKMGELFDQSYEQMAKGAFDAAVDAVDLGFRITHEKFKTLFLLRIIRAVGGQGWGAVRPARPALRMNAGPSWALHCRGTAIGTEFVRNSD